MRAGFAMTAVQNNKDMTIDDTLATGGLQGAPPPDRRPFRASVLPGIVFFPMELSELDPVYNDILCVLVRQPNPQGDHP